MSLRISLVLIGLLALPACARQARTTDRSAGDARNEALQSGVPEGDHTGSDPSQPPIDEGATATPPGAEAAPHEGHGATPRSESGISGSSGR